MPLNFSGTQIYFWGYNMLGWAYLIFGNLYFCPLIVDHFHCLNSSSFNRTNTNLSLTNIWKANINERHIKHFTGLSGVFLSESEEAERGPSSWPLAHTLKRVTDVMLYKVHLQSLKVTLHWVFALMSTTQGGHSTLFLQFVCSMINIRV